MQTNGALEFQEKLKGIARKLTSPRLAYLSVSRYDMTTTPKEDDRDFIGERLAPFNPSSDEVIRATIEMLQVKRASMFARHIDPIDSSRAAFVEPFSSLITFVSAIIGSLCSYFRWIRMMCCTI